MSTQAQLWMMLRLDKSLRSYGEEGSGLKPRELLQVRHAAASFRKVSLVPPTGHRLSSNDCKTMCQKARAVNFSSHIQSLHWLLHNYTLPIALTAYISKRSDCQTFACWAMVGGWSETDSRNNM